MLVGYMRVSSDSDRQTTDLQRDALHVLDSGLEKDNQVRIGEGRRLDHLDAVDLEPREPLRPL